MNFGWNFRLWDSLGKGLAVAILRLVASRPTQWAANRVWTFSFTSHRFKCETLLVFDCCESVFSSARILVCAEIHMIQGFSFFCAERISDPYLKTWNTRAIFPMARILFRIISFLAATAPPVKQTNRNHYNAAQPVATCGGDADVHISTRWRPS